MQVLRIALCICYTKHVLKGVTILLSVDPIQNIKDTLHDLGLKQFTKLLTNTELESDLMLKGAFTVFAPVDEAFDNLTLDQK